MSNQSSHIILQQKSSYADLSRKTGLAGTMLILVFSICLLMLPVGTWLMRILHDEVLLHRTSQTADHVLSTLPQVVSKTDLSRGELKLDLYQAHIYLQQQSEQLIPDPLKTRVSLAGVMVEQKQGNPNSMHWQKQDKQRQYYQVSCLFLVKGLGQRQYEIQKTIYLMLD